MVELRKIAVSIKLHEITSWPIAKEVWKLVRQRKINGEVVILDKDYLLSDVIPQLPKDKAQDSIYDYFENELGLDIAYAQKEITADPVNKELRDLMDLHPEDRHVVTVRSLVYLEDTHCFEYTESIHRLDKFRFVDFARRRKI